MPLFVNRVLNLKKIKVIGFDMDYTLVRYHVDRFEKLTWELARKVLVEQKGYTGKLLDLEFDFQRAIVGLVVDKRTGNLLKLSRFGKVRTCYHGLEQLPYKKLKDRYQERAIDLRDQDYESLDTSFAISHGILFSQVVQLKADGEDLPDYRTIADDVRESVDQVHKDGSIKSILVKNFDYYVIKDPEVPQLLERYKDYGKKLMIITNSDFKYTKALLDYAMDPFWKNHKSWQEVFDVVVTFAFKPRFFETRSLFLKINPETGAMSNYDGSLEGGVFQGGWFGQIQEDLGVAGSEILYLGDHIYGDVVSIKKRCNWRTALVLGDLADEMQGLENSRPLQARIDELMVQKQEIEDRLNTLYLEKYEENKLNKEELDHLYEESDRINKEISKLIKDFQTHFNPYWGPMLRAGNEESRYADQLERYACIYMTKVADLYPYSPKNYFRPQKRLLPHEMVVE